MLPSHPPSISTRCFLPNRHTHPHPPSPLPPHPKSIIPLNPLNPLNPPNPRNPRNPPNKFPRPRRSLISLLSNLLLHRRPIGSANGALMPTKQQPSLSSLSAPALTNKNPHQSKFPTRIRHPAAFNLHWQAQAASLAARRPVEIIENRSHTHLLLLQGFVHTASSSLVFVLYRFFIRPSSPSSSSSSSPLSSSSLRRRLCLSYLLTLGITPLVWKDKTKHQQV